MHGDGEFTWPDGRKYKGLARFVLPGHRAQKGEPGMTHVLYIYIYVYLHICTHLCIYIQIYVYIEIDRQIDRYLHTWAINCSWTLWNCTCLIYFKASLLSWPGCQCRADYEVKDLQYLPESWNLTVLQPQTKQKRDAPHKASYIHVAMEP